MLDGVRIGLPQSRPDLLGPFEKFCKDNDLAVTPVPFATDPEAHAALADGTIDLLLDAATSSDEQESFVLALDSMPMGIAGLRQNSGLLGVINDANAALEAQSPRFSELARQQFEDRTRRLVTHFTPAEQQLIEHLPTPDEQHALAAVSNGHTNLALSSVVSMQATRNLILYPNLVLVPSENRILIGTSLAISSREPRLLQSVFNKALLRLDPQEKERILLKNEIRTPPHFSLSYFVTFYPLQTGLLMGGILLLICLAIFLRTTLDRRRIAAAQHAALEAYKYKSQTDPLTGLYNKTATRELIEHYLLEPPAPGHCHAFFMMDLDHFKAANDLCGHDFGDEILISFAKSLHTIVRDRDLIGRFGGDEFVIFLKNCTRDAIPRIAGDINRAATLVDERSRMTNPDAQAHPERPLITVSIGIAIAASTHETYEEIFRKADHAVYRVKENGRGDWAIYGDGEGQH